jgi:hypothetical protein
VSSAITFVNVVLQSSSAIIALSLTLLSVLATFKEKNIDIKSATFNKVIWFLVLITLTLFWCTLILIVDSIYPCSEIITKNSFLIVIITAILFLSSVFLLVYFIIKNYNLVRKM